jgi:SAM-dependent methyltransferase
MSNHQTHVTEERWGDTDSTAALRSVFWTSSDVIGRYLNRRATGDPNADWLTWLDHVVLRPSGRALDCLVLGCGEGWLERALAPSPAVRSIVAMDISPKAVAEAERQAAEHDLEAIITYRVGNLDRDSLPVAAFDLVIAHSVLHHVEQLEFAYQEIASTLRPGGLLVINEYVGCCHLQYSDDQMERVNAIMEKLPVDLRRSALSGEVLERRIRPPLADVKATDPSEAIRSDEVLSAARAQFEILHQVDCGGSVLQPLLYELVPNFSDSDHDHRAMLELMVLLEENLVDAGVLASDFVFALAKRRRDLDLMFDLPSMPVTARSDDHPPKSPWLLRSRLPETGGLTGLAEHLAQRITGGPDRDPLDWIIRQSCPGILRSSKRSRARLLDSRDVETLLRPRFHDLAIGWPSSGDDTPRQIVLSLGGIGSSELTDSAMVKRLATTVAAGGALVLLVPCRDLGRAPAESTRARVCAAARVLPPRFDLSPLFDPIPAELETAPPVDLTVLRESLESHFDIQRWIPLGWPILNVLIPAVAHQFNPKSEADATLLRLLCLLDQQLVDDGVLPTEFLLVIARRKRTPT